ncbi:hypothetical protein [Ureibacillus aquaedulcis]|uniref:Uncharacterized protein n=1 Tax=Ureibacillus aquaedulcis TaxID=3058421 RepID=A0ABT8GMA6_9BACL|nr:hypothetical protein [Ureibacillus sp. BA0131]MDN4492555.1 hypothetical protein [Ureibacillus sp. BA0131]
MPTDDIISQWAAKFDLYENFLYQMFGTIRYEHLFKTKIEPYGFRKQLPVLKAVEVGERLYTVTVIKQYENASVVQLHIDSDNLDDSPPVDLTKKRNNVNFELFIDDKYDCRKDRAGGGNGHYTCSFIVSPALPDDVTGVDLVFKEYSDNFMENPTGLEIKINIE